jgi:hypothetical protein
MKRLKNAPENCMKYVNLFQDLTLLPLPFPHAPLSAIFSSMKYTQYYIPTLREVPNDAVIASHLSLILHRVVVCYHRI